MWQRTRPEDINNEHKWIQAAERFYVRIERSFERYNASMSSSTTQAQQPRRSRLGTGAGASRTSPRKSIQPGKRAQRRLKLLPEELALSSLAKCVVSFSCKGHILSLTPETIVAVSDAGLSLGQTCDDHFKTKTFVARVFKAYNEACLLIAKLNASMSSS